MPSRRSIHWSHEGSGIHATDWRVVPRPLALVPVCRAEILLIGFAQC